ncbi:MAG: hypothetical protein WC683_02620 [bacterium]
MQPEDWAQMKALAESADAAQRVWGVDPHTGMSREMVAGIGKVVFSTVGPMNSDEDLLDALSEHQLDFDPAQGLAIATMAAKPGDQLILIGSHRWAQGGFPQVTMGHKYAAALMATCVTDEMREHILMPWPAFDIVVPEGLIQIKNDTTGRLSDIRHVLVTSLRWRDKRTYGWAMVAFSDSSVLIWRYGPDVTCLLDVKENSAHWDECSFVHPFEEVDERAAALLGRLVCGTCLAMSDPSNIRPPKQNKIDAGHRSAKLRDGPPTIATYQVGKPIKIDCRPAIRQYMEGKRKAGIPQVQVLVRGHWKMQPHGVNRALRKAIQIEPYWRGAEDAPINVREHVLGKEDT